MKETLLDHPTSPRIEASERVEFAGPAKMGNTIILYQFLSFPFMVHYWMLTSGQETIYRSRGVAPTSECSRSHYICLLDRQ